MWGEEACPEGRCRAVRSSFVFDGDFLLLLAESYPPEAKRKSHSPETKYDTFAKRPCNDRRMSRSHDRSFPLIPAAGSGIIFGIFPGGEARKRVIPYAFSENDHR